MTLEETARNWLPAIGSVAVVLTMLVGAVIYVAHIQGNVGTLESDVATLRDDVSALQSDVKTLRDDLSTVKVDLAVVRTRLDTNHKEILDAIQDLAIGAPPVVDASDAARVEP